jgi:hypothetical protein
MSKFELSDAVTLFSQETATINSLWTVYVVATFAATAYGYSAPTFSAVQAGAVTFGFVAFAFGNWKLLRQGLIINLELKDEILSAVSSDSGNQFQSSIKKLAATANPTWISRLIHLFIDACVIVAIWSRSPDAVVVWNEGVALVNKVLGYPMPSN